MISPISNSNVNPAAPAPSNQKPQPAASQSSDSPQDTVHLSPTAQAATASADVDHDGDSALAVGLIPSSFSGTRAFSQIGSRVFLHLHRQPPELTSLISFEECRNIECTLERLPLSSRSRSLTTGVQPRQIRGTYGTSTRLERCGTRATL